MVEAYTASWIEIPLSGNCSATEMSKPIRLRGLKLLHMAVLAECLCRSLYGFVD